MIVPNPVDSPSVHAHKRQLAWQILVPILVVTVLIITAAVLVASATASSSRTLADVSTIWLIAPMLILALILTTALIALIYGIAMLLKVTPRYTAKAQSYIAAAAAGTRKISNGATKPIIWFHQAGTVIKSIFKMQG